MPAKLGAPVVRLTEAEVRELYEAAIAEGRRCAAEGDAVTARALARMAYHYGVRLAYREFAAPVSAGSPS